METEEKNLLIKKARNAYMKQWRKNNKERIKIINSRYWLKKAIKRKSK